MVLTKDFELLTSRYAERAPKSAALHHRASKVHPGGDTRSVLSIEPFPIYMQSRRDAEVVDVDGNVYIDALNNFTALIHGGRTDFLSDVTIEQLQRGVAFGSPTALSVELGEVLLSRVDSIDRIRFCNSGTEAVMHSIRAARAFTNKSKILIFQHGYHGSYEGTALLDELGANSLHQPDLSLSGSGILESVADQVLVAPYNDLDSASDLARCAGDELAAILVEPMQNAAGCIPGRREFLSGLLDLANELGALLIFDEVVTMRLSRGGLQESLDIKPHLTALGKIIGGGFPIGAFGGMAQVMQAYEPVYGRIKHSGTFNAFPISMITGLSALAIYDQPEIDRLERLGIQLSRGLSELGGRISASVSVTGLGSLWNLTWNDSDADSTGSGSSMQHAFYKACMINGLQIAPRGMFALSTAMDSETVDEILSRVELAMEMVAEVA